MRWAGRVARMKQTKKILLIFVTQSEGIIALLKRWEDNSKCML